MRHMNRYFSILVLTVYFLLEVRECVGVTKDSVVQTFSGCDYFIADGPRGLYVLEWYGGHIPSESDTISGDIGSYGMKDVRYNYGSSGNVWVEDFLETSNSAMEEIRDHCE